MYQTVAILLFFLSPFATVCAKESALNGIISGPRIFRVASLLQYGTGQPLIMSVPIYSGSFCLTFPAGTKAGIYKLLLKDDAGEASFDFVWQYEDVEVDVNAAGIVFKPGANSSWYAFLKKEGELLKTIGTLTDSITQSDDWNDVKTTELIRLDNNAIQELNILRDTFLSAEKNEWTVAMVKNRAYDFKNLRQMPALQRLQERNHYWDQINTSELKLLNSPLYDYHIQTYLAKCLEGIESNDEKTKICKRAAIHIVQRFSKNKRAREWACDYLKTYFRITMQPQVLAYLMEENQFNSTRY